jgi:isopentenyldiphosphate isomerase
MSELLNIVDDDDEIIGEETRVDIHKNGYLHREIHVYFVTPNNEIIFQHRAKDKDTYPDLLDATVGGHVEIDHGYLETALKETEEETGMKLEESDLILINKIKKTSFDKITEKTNNVFNCRYVYFYKGDVRDLKIEAGKAVGFEVISIDKLLSLSEAEKARFIPYIYNFVTTELVEFLKKINVKKPH